MTVGGKRTGKWTFPNGLWCFDDQLDYDVSWSRLMPVVEKIDSLGYFVTIMRTRTIINISNNVQHQIQSIHPGYSMIEVAYCAVIEFIKWYNSIKENSPEDGVRKHE